MLHRRSFLSTTALSLAGMTLAGRARGEALPIEPGSWTLVLLPDTQYYSESYPQHFDAQTRWIVEHHDLHNIKYVLHEGDITNNNSPQQWDNALRSLRMLDGVVPYSLTVGNHDCGPGGSAANRDTQFHLWKYFGPDTTYAGQPSLGGFFEPERTENSFHTFEAGDRQWLVLALEWAPRDGVIAWANEVVDDHANHLAMLVTHAYMYNDDTRYDRAAKKDAQKWNPHSYGLARLPNESVNDGQQLWEKLVSRHENFRFAFNGHVLGDGTGLLTSTGSHGNVVHQILANYQFNAEGGQGDLRLLEFKPDGKTVEVRTYSPVLDRYDTAADQQFTLVY